MAEPARSKASADDGPVPQAVPSPAHSVTALAHESRRYRDDTNARRPPLRIRSLRAYWTTWRVIWSYLWLRFRAHPQFVDCRIELARPNQSQAQSPRSRKRINFHASFLFLHGFIGSVQYGQNVTVQMAGFSKGWT